MSEIGARARQLDWAAQTDGRFRYTGDLPAEGVLRASVLRSPHPFARILSIDTARAAALPGVRAIVTAADFPAGARYLHEGAADRAPLADGVVRFVGQEVAAVAADDEATAQAACAAIEVRYARQPAPLGIAAAVRPRALHLHERPTGLCNRAALFHRRWGDFAAGRDAAARGVAGRFVFAAQHHACMEPGGVLATWDEAEQRLELWSPTGAPYYVVQEVAHVLGLAPGQVICREIGVGGSFGARTKVCEYEAIAAMLSRKAGRPVRLILSRAEDFATTKSRHAFEMELCLHGDVNGRLRAIEGDIRVDNGAYSHSGASVTSAGLKGLGMLYRPDGLDMSAALVDTAKPPGGSFRGYGSTQTGFALESLVDELALADGRDPLDYRLANANPAGTTTLVGAKLGSSGLSACLEACRDRLDWPHLRSDRLAGVGVGIASAVHVSGSHVGGETNRSDCAIDLFADGRAHVRFGSGDAGTGQKTILAQIVATELGLPLDRVTAEMIDSERTPFDMGSWSSRGTHYGGHAARQAARLLRERLTEAAQPELGNAPPRFEHGMLHGSGGSWPLGELVERCPEAKGGRLSVQTAYVEQAVEPADKASGIGNISASYNFAAHAAVVHVCELTGAVRLLRFVAAHDVGTPINPTFVEGQIVGGAVMGIGAALGEEVVTEQGRMVNGAFVDYAMPRAGDVPRVEAILVAGEDPAGPYGAKGVGETGINPPPAAIANAIRDAIGIRLTETPFTPDKVLGAIAAASGHRRRHQLWRRPSRWWISLVRWLYPRGLLDLLHRRVEGRFPANEARRIARIDRPAGLKGLADALREGARPLGGGVDLQALRQQGHPGPVHLAAVADVTELGGILRDEQGGWRIGASVTLKALALATAADLPVLGEAIGTVASPQIRAVATLGGNLLQEKRCWFFRNGFDCYKRRGGLAPCYAIAGDHRFHHAAVDGHRCQAVTPSDLATVLLALGAEAIVAMPDGGERRLSFDRLYVGPGETALGLGELLRAIHIPACAGRLSATFEKLRLWEGGFAIVSVCVAWEREGERARDIRIALGGIAPVPIRLGRAERAIEGIVPDDDAVRRLVGDAIDHIGHPLPGNGWKLDAACGVVRKAAARLRSLDARQHAA